MATILIVDACKTDTQAFAQSLEKEGHNVIITDNGADGVAIARYKQPDAVLVDITLPGLNGFQLSRQLASNLQTADIPVIIVTTKDQKTDRVWGKRQGACDYLVKPVDNAQLNKAIEQVLSCETCV